MLRTYSPLRDGIQLTNKMVEDGHGPYDRYICGDCKGTGYRDVGACGSCEGCGKLCWKPFLYDGLDDMLVIVPGKFYNMTRMLWEEHLGIEIGLLEEAFREYERERKHE